MSETIAFVGAVGGAGTTRVTLACAELLARDGHDTVVLDAAYATQGLAGRTHGSIDPDMTKLCLDDRPLEPGLVDRSIDGGGRLAVCPAHAPFSRLAKAKTPDAAQRFEDRIEEAARQFEVVLIDTPPIAANQAVAAATSADTVAVVCDANRAESAIPRTTDRLADIGIDEHATIVTRTSEHPDADATVPTLDPEPPALEDSEATHEAILPVLTATTDVGVSIERESADGFFADLSLR